MTFKHLAVSVVAIFILIFVIFTMVFTVGTNAYTDLSAPEEFAAFDFSENPGYVNSELFEKYPGRLYTPEDFGSMKSKGIPDDKEKINGVSTYRILLNLPAGTEFSVYNSNEECAQKMWINGRFVSEIGKLGDNPDEFEPDIKSYFVSFFSDGEPTEIIVQSADLNSRNENCFTGFYLGTTAKMNRLTNLLFFSVTLPLGAMIAMTLIFFAAFLFFTKQAQFLWFALTCAVLSSLSLIRTPYLLELLYPFLGLSAYIRITAFLQSLFVIFITLYADKVFETSLLPWLKRLIVITGCINVIFLCILSFEKSGFFIGFSPWYVTVSCAVLALSVVADGAKKHFIERNPFRSEQVIVVCGSMIVCFLAFIDAIKHGSMGNTNFLEAGILIFVSSGAISLTMSFARTEEMLQASLNRETEISLEKKSLEELNKMKADFMANIGHELKTPLTVMGSYAGLTIRQIKKESVTSETVQNLDIIQKEAVRLGLLVEQLTATAKGVREERDSKTVSVEELFNRASTFCNPVCSKNNNTIIVYPPDEKLFVLGGADALFQVLYNLIANANRHTQNGYIKLTAERIHKVVRIHVNDNGEGVPEQQLERIFERGYSGDNSSGIGLALCRDIIEGYSGSIRIDNLSSGGAEVTILLPYCEDENNENDAERNTMQTGDDEDE